MSGGLRYEEDEVTVCGTDLPHGRMWGEIDSLTRAPDDDLTVPPPNFIVARHLGLMLARRLCQPLFWLQTLCRRCCNLDFQGSGETLVRLQTGGNSMSTVVKPFFEAQILSSPKCFAWWHQRDPDTIMLIIVLPCLLTTQECLV